MASISHINQILATKGKITTQDLTNNLKITRQAAHKQLKKLVVQKILIKVGKTRNSYYIAYSTRNAKETLQEIKYNKTWNVKNLHEDTMLKSIQMQINLEKFLNKNTMGIFNYAFTEMLNNVIEHSKSQSVNIQLNIKDNIISFLLKDTGIGIFNSLKNKFHIMDDYQCLDFLLKVKKTTMPEAHSGEGIFFTSKIADEFHIESSKIKLIINNILNDIFVEEIKKKSGTLIFFEIKCQSKKSLENLFKSYTSEDVKFDKTLVRIKLHTNETNYISRSQARRLLFGLDEFQKIVLDFKGIKTIGQGFTDEIFRVYKNRFPKKKLIPINYSKAIEFMIERSKNN